MKHLERKSKRNTLFYTLVIVVSLIIGTIMFLPHIAEKVWPYKSYVVVSDSMEPLINRNDMILVRIENEYNIGDIITFAYDVNNDGEDDLITHFLASNNDDIIKTRSNKGSSLDNWEIKEKNIIGKVRYVVPKIGFLMIPVFNNAVFFLGFALILVLWTIFKVLRDQER